MKKQFLAIAALATIATGAFAGEADPSGQYALQIEGSRTRAEVQAEAVAAVKAGTTAPSAIPASSKVQAPVHSTQTAAAVRAQAVQSARVGAYGERNVF